MFQLLLTAEVCFAQGLPLLALSVCCEDDKEGFACFSHTPIFFLWELSLVCLFVPAVVHASGKRRSVCGRKRGFVGEVRNKKTTTTFIMWIWCTFWHAFYISVYVRARLWVWLCPCVFSTCTKHTQIICFQEHFISVLVTSDFSSLRFH